MSLDKPLMDEEERLEENPVHSYSAYPPVQLSYDTASTASSIESNNMSDIESDETYEWNNYEDGSDRKCCECEPFAVPCCGSSTAPVLKHFCGPFRLLGLVPHHTSLSPATHLIYQCFILLLISWSCLGWWLKMIFLMAGKDFHVPGWYEVGVSEAHSYPGAQIMTLIPICSYIFSRNYFKHHKEHLGRIAYHQPFMNCIGTQASLRRICKKEVTFVYVWAILTSVLGRMVSMSADLFSEHDDGSDQILNSPAGGLIYDMIVTLVSFALQFGIVALFAAYVSVICQVHATQLGNFSMWLRKQKYSVCDVVDKHSVALQSIRRTSKMFQFYISVIGLLSILGFVFTATEAVLAPRNEAEQVALGLRIMYAVGYIVPIFKMLWTATMVRTNMERLLSTVNRLPPRSDVSESTFLNTYFMAGLATDKWGFRVFGYVVNSTHMLRTINLLFVIVAASLQYKITTHRNSSQ